MSAREVNTLIYHYFLETGLHTSAFALRAEAGLPVSSQIMPGTLLAYLEKALLFTQIETHLFASGQQPKQKCIANMTLLGKHECAFEDADMNGLANETMESNGNASLTGHSAEISNVCWSPYSQVILTAAQDGSARLWKAENRLQESKALAILPHISKTGSVGKTVKALPWTVTSTQSHGVAVTLSEDGIGRMWDLKGNLTQVLMEQPGIRLGKWNKHGTALATIGKDNYTAVWGPTGTLTKQYAAAESPITCIDWLSDTEFILGTESGQIVVSSLNQSQSAPIAVQSGAVTILVSHAGGDFFAAASEQGVGVWTVTGATVLQQSVSATALAWNPKFAVLTIGLASGGIFSWDANSRSTVEIAEKHKGPITAICYRTEGDLFACASGDNRLAVWNLRDGRLLCDIPTPSPVTDM